MTKGRQSGKNKLLYFCLVSEFRVRRGLNSCKDFQFHQLVASVTSLSVQSLSILSLVARKGSWGKEGEIMERLEYSYLKSLYFMNQYLLYTFISFILKPCLHKIRGISLLSDIVDLLQAIHGKREEVLLDHLHSMYGIGVYLLPYGSTIRIFASV